MSDQTSHPYVLAGGRKARDRLRVLAGVTEPGTRQLLARTGPEPAQSCLDVGCGGGDVSRLLAERVGPRGRVVGLDADADLVRIAASEAQSAGLAPVTFRAGSVFELEASPSFDFVYARFLLTHLAAPGDAIERMLGALRPGGVLVLEDIDFSGHFCFPPCPAFDAYCRLYASLVRASGGNPDLGPELPGMLGRAGLDGVRVHVSQPAGLSGDVKRVAALTMESIGPRLVAANLAEETEVGTILDGLLRAAEDPDLLMSIVRIVQTWGRKPAQRSAPPT